MLMQGAVPQLEVIKSTKSSIKNLIIFLGISFLKCWPISRCSPLFSKHSLLNHLQKSAQMQLQQPGREKLRRFFSDPVCLEFLRRAHSDTLVQLTWWLHRVPEWLRMGRIPQVFLVQTPAPRRVKQEHIGQSFLQCFLNVSRHETPKHLWANSLAFG